MEEEISQLIQLNIVSELTSKKRIHSLKFNPKLTFSELKNKLVEDKIISFTDSNSIQVWQST